MTLSRKSTIKQWDESDRPREKLLQKGRTALTDAELLTIILGSGSREQSALSLAKEILSSQRNNLKELSRLSVSDLMHFKGVGDAKAVSIVAALELGLRCAQGLHIEKPRIDQPEKAYQLIRSKLDGLDYEQFWIILLNRQALLIECHKISEGGVGSTVVDVRKIFKRAIEVLASQIILCHNHPSGSTKPSPQDLRITQKVCDGAQLLDLKIVDHIIIGQDAWRSMREESDFDFL